MYLAINLIEKWKNYFQAVLLILESTYEPCYKKMKQTKTKIFQNITKKQSIIVRLIIRSDYEKQFKNSQINT